MLVSGPLPGLKFRKRRPGREAFAFAIPRSVPAAAAALLNVGPLCKRTWLIPKRTSFSRVGLKVWLQSTAMFSIGASEKPPDTKAKDFVVGLCCLAWE